MVERTEDGKFHPYVMDFGLARETSGGDHSRSGVIEGTPAYMAPEQARGESKHLDRRVDVYALGVTLYELLTGKLPFKAAGDLDILMAVLTQEPQPLRAIDANIPVDLEAVTLKCLEKEAAARYDSAKALADDLGRYLDGEPVQARRIGLSHRLYRRARKHKALVALGTALLLSLIGLFAYGVRARLAASQQAALAQKLGQEITKMEWLLRSARQLPLHDLEREKVIIRRRMAQLERELSSYGTLGKGLGHYALGRGHLALHEYPAALVELRQALLQGNDSSDVHYALGLVLGKHFEQAMYEARLSGGGDWANKQLKQIEPQYLIPAIASLQKSRALQSDTPGYLEALIAYYQRNYDVALKEAESARKEAPWLYEAAKLSGDIHLERALQARDSGKYDAAEKEFADAVKGYGEAAAIGQSDAEVYEGLAEAWVRQIEMALGRGQPTEAAYNAAIAASDKITTAEPQSVAGRLKKGYAAVMTMGSLGSGLSSAERVKQCLFEMQAVLEKQPDNPYASDVAAGCYAFAADGAPGRGEDPAPLLRKALSLLEPAVQRYPHFLWGLNDLANIYAVFGIYFQLHGDVQSREFLKKSLQYEASAISLDSTYLIALQNLLYDLAKLASMPATEQEKREMLNQVDNWFSKCMAINNQFQQCYINYFQVYVRTAYRTYLAGLDPQPQLEPALKTLQAIRKFGASFLDVEQYTALAYLVEAGDHVRHHQDPASSLVDMDAALARCFSQAAQDAMCRTLAAQRDWVLADFLMENKESAAAALQRALEKAITATQSPESYPDAWQVLAETHLRLATLLRSRSADREAHIAAGLVAIAKVFAINPNHVEGRATEESLRKLLQRDFDKQQ